MNISVAACRREKLARATWTMVILWSLCSGNYDLHSAPRAAWPPWPEPTLSIYRFNEVDWHPPLRPPPLGWDSATVAESWSESALVRDGLSVAPIALPMVDTAGSKSFAPGTGAVRFWFAPNWSSVANGGQGPGDYARLLELVSLNSGKAETRWALYADESGEGLYFGGMTATGKAKDFLKTKVDFTAGEWRMVTLCYAPEGSQLWLDDQLVAKGAAVPEPSQTEESGLGLVVGSDLGVTSPANGLFEEMSLFDYWPDAGQQQFYYNGVSRQVFLGTVDAAEEEALKQELLAAAYPKAMTLASEGEGGIILEAYSYESNVLYLEITGASNGVAHLLLHNAEPQLTYEIQSKEALTNAGWLAETNVLALEGETEVPVEVWMGERTNALFFRALAATADADGDGLPDWWELENGLDPALADTGNTGVSDGYKDGDNDGWNNLQEFQNGTSPSGFNTPPAPQGVSVHVNPSGDECTVSWTVSSAAVTNYVVERDWNWQTNQFSASSTPWTDGTVSILNEPYWFYETPRYRVSAQYSGGGSDWSDWLYPNETLNPAEARFLSTTAQSALLQVVGIPTEATHIRLSGAYYSSTLTNFDFPTVEFVDGAVSLPEYVRTNQDVQQWLFEIVRTNEQVSMSRLVLPNGHILEPPFVDGREALLQNLVFWLRSACTVDPLEFDDLNWQMNNYVFPPEFVYSSFVEAVDYGSGPEVNVDRWLPFEDNYRYRNCIFDASFLNPSSGWLSTGFELDSIYTGDFFLVSERTYDFVASNPVGPFPLLLSSADTRWLNPGWADWALGIRKDPDLVVMTHGVSNYYGLPLLSAQVVWAGGSSGLITTVLSAGSSVTNLDPTDQYLVFYPETAQPVFENSEYYFGQMDVHPFPGHDTFSLTNTAPTIIGAVGQTIEIAGYAKLAITNGYPDKFGYLGQYFDKAYRANPDGTRSTNETGFLSPYGEFFPTEPGRAILTTMPDGVSTNVGECTVHVIGLNVDANHDGVIDLSSTGLDHTSQNHPMVFWANNDFDRGHTVDVADWEEDDLLTAGCPAKPNTPTPDCDFQIIPGYYSIPSARDLEDYTRLWLPGLAALHEAYSNLTFQLSIVSDGTMGDPAINLFVAADTNGSALYLTDTIAADDQLSASVSYLARVEPGDPLLLHDLFLPSGQPSDYFIFCGAKRGSGQLVLTVLNGTEVLAETSLYIQLKNIKEMYERWTVGDNPSVEPTDTACIATEQLPTGVPEFQYRSPEESDTPYIVFVHGWNLESWSKDRWAETAFKRLYWQVYQGRFGSFRWPTYYKFGTPWESWVNPLTRPEHFDDSEFNGWKSAAGLLNLLTDLHAQYGDQVYVLGHSLGTVVAGEAFRLAGTNQLVNTYVASQGALAAHMYDSTLSDALFTSLSPDTPNIYKNWLATNNGTVGRRISFYNANDYALQDDRWGLNQQLKPDTSITMFGWTYIFDGSPYDNTQSYTPGAPDDTPPWRFFIKEREYEIADFDLSLSGPIADRYEVMSHAAQARSGALGKTSGVAGTSLNVDLGRS